MPHTAKRARVAKETLWTSVHWVAKAIVIAVIAPAFAQSASAQSVAQERKSVDVPKISSVPVIDGILDDQTWQEAAVITDFRQTDPVLDADPTQKTVAYIAYDSDTIYLAGRFYEDDPELIVAKELGRDGNGIWSDDNVQIAIDTFLDRRNAFNFAINPIGSKFDERIENNSTFRPEWDAIWEAKANIDDEGWTFEMAIPTKSLSFNPGTDVWGLEIERTIARSNEIIRWAIISQDFQFASVNMYGDAKGITGLRQGIGLDIKPILATNRIREEDGDTDVRIRAGAEIVYKATPAVTASLVINPDFSETVVDDITPNLGRFGLFIPEQRAFFVRDADIFQFAGLDEENGQPFFSRRIALERREQNPDDIDINVGAKITGRFDGYTFGALTTQVEANNGVDRKEISVVRGTANILDESRIGFMVTDGDPASNLSNRTYGLDFRYRNSEVFGDQEFIADIWAVKSDTPGLEGDDYAYGVRLDYPNDKWDARINFREIQANYNPALGFSNRGAIRNYSARSRYRHRPETGFVRFFDYSVFGGLTTDLDNTLESAWWTLGFLNAESQVGDRLELFIEYNREILPEPFEIFEGVTIPGGDYSWNAWGGLVKMAEFHRLRGEIEWVHGDYYEGNQLDITGRVFYRPTNWLFMSYEHQFINTNLPQGDFDIRVNRVRANVTFNTEMEWTNYVQHEDERDIILLQSQFRWIVQPGNELTFTLNQNWQQETLADGRRSSFRTVNSGLSAQLAWTFRY